MNQAISRDLEWVKHYIKTLDGIILLRELSWTPNQADFTAFCDTSLSGLGFWFPSSRKGFINSTPSANTEEIFFREALSIASALYESSKSLFQVCIVIYTDSDNTVQIFCSLHALPHFNSILKFCVNILIAHKIQLKVLHIPGVQNQVTDALSRRDFDRALKLIPNLSITSFQPP